MSRQTPSSARCPRCQAFASRPDGCTACGHPLQPGLELHRQELLATYLLEQVAQGANVDVMRARAAERLRTATQAPRLAAVASQAPAAPPPAPAPLPAPTPAPVVRPVVVDPVLARQRLQLRLELGVWFVGALFAVGGSLWATNLFWASIPATMRPTLVGGGLALFAAAFIAVGAVLAKRYANSAAGTVLGLVGRLIAISAAVPLATAPVHHAGLALPGSAAVFAIVVVSLLLGRTQRMTSSALFLCAWLLLLATALHPIAALVAAFGSIALLRAGFSVRTDDALAGRPAWVDDVAAVLVTCASLVLAFLSTRVGNGPAWLLLGALFVDTLGRGAAQRPSFLPHDRRVRRATLACILVLTCIGAGGALATSSGFLFAGGALALAAAHLWHQAPAGLPAAARPIAHGLLASAATCVARSIDLPDWMCGAVFAGALLVLGHRLRREADGVPTLGVHVATMLVWLVALPLLASSGRGLELAPALGIAFAAFASDRRAERAPAFAFVTWSLAALPIGLVLDQRGSSLAQLALVFVALLACAVLVLRALRGARPALPLLAATSSGLLWLGMLAGVAALWAHFGAAQQALPVLAAAVVGGVALLVASESSRNSDAAFVGAGALVVAGATRGADLPFSLALGAGACALAAFVPAVVRRTRRLVPRGRAVLGHGGRALGLWWAAAAGVAALLVFRLAAHVDALPGVPFDPRLLASALVVAAVLLFVRARSVWSASGVVLVLAVVAGDLVPAWADVPALVSTTFGSLAALAATAVLLVELRGREVRLPVVVRLRPRRGKHRPIADVAWPGVAVLSATVFVAGVLLRASVTSSPRELASFLLLATLVCAALFALRAQQGLLVGCVVLATLAGGLMLVEQLQRGADRAALGAALLIIALQVVVLRVARAMYGRRMVPSRLAGWPQPDALRAPALALLVVAAVATATTAKLLRPLNLDASRYAPAVIIVAASLFVAAFVVVHLWRTVAGALVAGVLAALAGMAIPWSALAAGWIQQPRGQGQAVVAGLLVVVVWALHAEGGRRALIALGLGLPRRVRDLAAPALVVAVAGLALSSTFAARVEEHLTGATLAIAGAVLVLLAFVHRRSSTAVLGALGASVFCAGLATVFVEGAAAIGALDVAGAPVLVAAALVGAALAQGFGRSVVGDVSGAAARASAEVIAGIAVAFLVALAAMSAAPAPLALTSTWVALAMAMVVFGRASIERDQITFAALAEGAALALYVDLRRRTPWLDGVGHVDVVALLTFAVLFAGARFLLPKRSALGRAAELYAATLPIVASALGGSEGGRIAALVVGGCLYGVLTGTRKRVRYEVAAGAMFLVATELALRMQRVEDPVLYLLPVAVVATFLARRHRARFGALGRVLALFCHVPLYCTAAWSALSQRTFGAFALGILVVTGGVAYAMFSRDRRALYAAAVAGAVLVIGRLVIAGLDNALFGTLLLVGCGVVLLGGMTLFTIRRDTAAHALKRAGERLTAWGDDDAQGDTDDVKGARRRSGDARARRSQRGPRGPG